MLNFFRKNKEQVAEINTDTEPVILTVEKGKTLLNAALRSGIGWPHKCKVGSCGTCKCLILSGQIKPQIDFSYVLSPKDIADGYVLACQSELKSDIKVDVKLIKKLGDKK
jgi:CDP-4-dehydro-6-deoxyglucose reductase